MTPIKLDDRDIKILAILSREGRISKSDLAKRVNLSATPCWERLSRLEKAGIISGYRADIELKNIAPQVSVFVMAELENHRAATFQAFEQAVEHMTKLYPAGHWVEALITCSMSSPATSTATSA
jgi:Lrp/AsnC family transcriptional regulator of ectoine degradation